MSSKVLAIGKAADLAATRSWYLAAGFEVRPDGAAVDATWLEVERGGLVLQFIAGATPWPGEPAFTGSFYVHVDDMERAASALTAPVEAEWGVEDRAWGSRELTMQDPNGYFITFVQDAGNQSLTDVTSPDGQEVAERNSATAPRSAAREEARGAAAARTSTRS